MDSRDAESDWEYLRDQIDWRMKAKGFNQKSLALAAGLHATAVRDILTGRSKRPGTDKVTAIARVLGCSVDELTVRPRPGLAVPHYGPVPARVAGHDEHGRAVMERLTESSRPSPTVSPEPAGAPAGMVAAPMPNLSNLEHDVPIYGVTRGGKEGEGDFRFNGHLAGHERRPPGLRGMKDAFCLFVQGESMAPWRNEGERVFLNPARPARIGDHVVVELKPERDGEAGTAYLKRLVARSADGSLILEQYHPPDKKIRVPGAKVKRVFRVMEWEELLFG